MARTLIAPMQNKSSFRMLWRAVCRGVWPL